MRLKPPEYYMSEFQESLDRAIKLANTPNGSGHQTFLSGIRVSFDLIYPNYISPELQRYHWIDIVTSSSKMHRLAKMNIRACCNEHVDLRVFDIITELQVRYNADPTYDNFIKLVSTCPQGIELFMRISTNYLQLKTIYHQRKNHKLREDWVEGFCRDFVEKLPYAKEFIIGQ